MKKFGLTSEIITAGILLGILLLFVLPTKLLMPDTLKLMVTIALILAFLVFAALIWQERSADEREEYHRLQAGRIAFLVGTSSLVLGIVVQSLRHNVDPWLVYTLTAMVLAKLCSRIYSRIRH